MSYNTKNYMEQGGGKLVIDGELVVTENATVTGLVDVALLKAATANKFGAVKAAARTPATDTVEAKIGTDGKLYVPTYPADLPFSPATADDLGCVIAAPAGETDTVEAKIGADNKLYVPAYPTIPEMPVAAANEVGGIKADVKGEGDTVPAKVGADGNLYVPTYPVVPEMPVAANMPTSEAATVELLLADFNALLAALKDAGLMVADKPEQGE